MTETPDDPGKAAPETSPPPAAGPAHAVLGGPGRVPAAFSVFRVWTLVMSTFTQLVRMKTFYFLIAFALFAFLWGLLPLQYTPAQKLRNTSEVSLGVMWVFSWLFAISATALLIPRDIEDRTLYTILAKPVSRLEYLLGKLGGVLMTIGISLLVMHLVYAATLAVWEGFLVGAEQAAIEARVSALEADPRFTPEEREAEREALEASVELIRAYGLRWEQLYATLAIFLQASIVATITLLISTFASSTLFSIIITVVIFVIGHFHKLTGKFWIYQSGDNALVRILGKFLGLIIPDFRLFDLNLAELIFQGEAIPIGLMGELAGLAALYIGIYLFISLYLFIDKEF